MLRNIPFKFELFQKLGNHVHENYHFRLDAALWRTQSQIMWDGCTLMSLNTIIQNVDSHI